MPTGGSPPSTRQSILADVAAAHTGRVARISAVAREFGDFERFGALMGEGAVLHIGGGQIACDPAATRAIAEEWTSAFPDWRFELLRVVAEGTLVVAHMPYSGTHHGRIAGVEPTGRSCTVDEIVIFRIADSRIAEAWEVYDDAGMWRQLGVTPPGWPPRTGIAGGHSSYRISN